MPKDPIRHAEMVEEIRKRSTGNKYSLGLKQSEEQRQWRRENYKGVKNPMFGKHHTAEARVKMSNAPKCKGEKHYAWKGGTGKWWRQNVLRQANYTCNRCGLQDYSEGFMEVDHIKSKVIYPELQHELSNGQVLCPNCHRRKTMEDRRAKQYFSKKVDSRGHILVKP